MKKLTILGLFGIVMLSGCGNGNNVLSGLGGLGGTGSLAPYSISMDSWGYEIDDQGKITIPSIQVSVYSTKGAPDINTLDFSATLLDENDEPAVGADSQILHKGGNLMSGVKGGYICTSTAAVDCTAISGDAVLKNAGPDFWATNNRVTKGINIGEWATWHSRHSAPNEGIATAPFYVSVDFTAKQANGGVVEWTQRYQFVSPLRR